MTALGVRQMARSTAGILTEPTVLACALRWWSRNRIKERRMFGLGIVGTILLIIIILWLLGVIG
jgi:hypothetical protein